MLLVTVLDIIISFFHHFIVIVLEANKQFLCHRNFVWILNVIVGPVTIAIASVHVLFVNAFTFDLWKHLNYTNKNFSITKTFKENHAIMEAVPKMPMLHFNLKQTQQKSSFSRLKQVILLSWFWNKLIDFILSYWKLSNYHIVAPTKSN